MPPLSGLGRASTPFPGGTGREGERTDDGGVCLTRSKLIDIGAQLNKQEAEQREEAQD